MNNDYFPIADMELQSSTTEKPVAPLVTHQASLLDGMVPPPRDWHVEGLIPSRNVTLLYGDGGTGKSLLALQLAVATATGGYWVGGEARLGTVLFISAEDDEDELHRRLIDICNGADVRIRDLNRLHYRSLVGSDTVLAELKDSRGSLRTTQLFKELEAAVRNIKPDLIVLDTLANLFAGDENQRSQAQQFIGLIRKLCSDHGATVVVLAHPSLGGMARGDGTSGSTAWSNSVRSRLYLKRIKAADGSEDDADTRILETGKVNYAGAGRKIDLRWKEGRFVPALTGDPLAQGAGQAKAERIFLRLLEHYEIDKRRVGATTGHGYAPTVFAADPRSENVSKRSFAVAMNSLFANGRIKIEETGPQSRRVSHIVTAQRGG